MCLMSCSCIYCIRFKPSSIDQVGFLLDLFLIQYMQLLCTAVFYCMVLSRLHTSGSDIYKADGHHQGSVFPSLSEFLHPDAAVGERLTQKCTP